MGDLYPPPTLLDYNENPPSDDGQRTASNLAKWSGILEKLTDPLKTFAQSINANINTAFNRTISGGPALSIIADYTMVGADQGALLVISGAASKTVTLVDPVAVGAPYAFTACNVGDGPAFFTPPGATLINGLSSIGVSKGESIGVQTDGTNFYTFGGFPSSATGDIAWNLSLVAPAGFIALETKTLGSAGAGSDYAGDLYKSLYAYLWTNIDDQDAPVTGGRGSTAENDFLAAKVLQMPGMEGRSSVGVDPTNSVITALSAGGANATRVGGSGGEDVHTQLGTEVGAHTHPEAGNPAQTGSFNSAGGPSALLNAQGTTEPNAAPVPMSVISPWRTFSCWIRL